MVNKPLKPPAALDKKNLLKRYSEGPQNLQTGNKVYNGGGSSPHAGGGLNKSGFQLRDQQANAKKDFMMKRLKSGGF